MSDIQSTSSDRKTRRSSRIKREEILAVDKEEDTSVQLEVEERKISQAPLYLSKDPLHHACQLFLDNYVQDLDQNLREWTRNATQNLFLAGQACRFDLDGIGLSIQKAPIHLLDKFFDADFDTNMKRMTKLLLLLDDTKKSYCIVGYFFCFRSHALHQVDEMTNEEFDSNRLKLIHVFSTFSAWFQSMLNGIRPQLPDNERNLNDEDEELKDLYTEILKRFPKTPEPKSTFKIKHYSKALKWQKELCEELRFLDFTDSKNIKENLPRSSVNELITLLQWNTKEDLTQFGYKYRDLSCLFKKPEKFMDPQLLLGLDQSIDHSNPLAQTLIQQQQQTAALIRKLQDDIAELHQEKTARDQQINDLKTRLNSIDTSQTNSSLKMEEISSAPTSSTSRRPSRKSLNTTLDTDDTPLDDKQCKNCHRFDMCLKRGLCDACYKRLAQPRRQCKVCNEYRPITGGNMCDPCYKKHGREKRNCAECGKLTCLMAKNLCSYCYRLKWLKLAGRKVPKNPYGQRKTSEVKKIVKKTKAAKKVVKNEVVGQSSTKPSNRKPAVLTNAQKLCSECNSAQARCRGLCSKCYTSQRRSIPCVKCHQGMNYARNLCYPCYREEGNKQSGVINGNRTQSPSPSSSSSNVQTTSTCNILSLQPLDASMFANKETNQNTVSSWLTLSNMRSTIKEIKAEMEEEN